MKFLLSVIMELYFSFFPIIVCSVFFMFMVLKLGKRTKQRSKLPPGPWKLPLIGNLHQMIGSPPHVALRDLANKYGGLMYIQLGEIPTIVVSSGEYAEEVMKTNDVMFASRPKLTSARILSYNFSSITFSPYGEYWRQLRKICVFELLSARRVQSLRPIREEEVSKFINWVYSKADDGLPINITEKIFSSTYSLVSRIIFNERAEKTDEFISVLKETSRLVGGFNVADAFPSVKLFHLISGVSSDLERVNKRGSKILGEIIDQHIKAKVDSEARKKEDEEEEEEEEDLVDVLLKFHGSDNDFTLTIDNIKAIVQDIFGGGSDTSASTIDWAMVEMIRCPRVMEKAQAEVRRVFNSKVSVDETGLSEMNYLKLIIKETLRLHPPVPLSPRENSERCEINGYEIPAKTRVIVNAWAFGRDPKYWGAEAERFYPERFVDNPIDFKGGNYGYIPFGAGRRICPGMIFGLSNVEYLLSQMLYYFDWKLPGGTTPRDLDTTDSFGLTMRRRDDLYLIPAPCNNTHTFES